MRPIPEHGTDSRYHRHRRIEHTDPCQACKTGHTQAELARQERRRRRQLRSIWW